MHVAEPVWKPDGGKNSWSLVTSFNQVEYGVKTDFCRLVYRPNETRWKKLCQWLFKPKYGSTQMYPAFFSLNDSKWTTNLEEIGYQEKSSDRQNLRTVFTTHTLCPHQPLCRAESSPPIMLKIKSRKKARNKCIDNSFIHAYSKECPVKTPFFHLEFLTWSSEKKDNDFYDVKLFIMKALPS